MEGGAIARCRLPVLLEQASSKTAGKHSRGPRVRSTHRAATSKHLATSSERRCR